MTAVETFDAKTYKSDLNPVWCPGCGDYSVVGALYKAMAELQLQPWDTVVVSGIGCSSRLPGYVETFGINGIHGRALTIATGVKLGRPELNVIAVGGDGDGTAIGGNHFLHTARRNLDIAYIMMDNEIYGLTKGQAAPTTPTGDPTKSTLYGNPEPSLDPCALAICSGATWVGRAFAGDPKNLVSLMARAMRHHGFAFLNVISPCVTFRGDGQFKELRLKARVLPADHDPTSREAALRYTGEAGDTMTIGLLYEVQEPSLVDRLDAVKVAAKKKRGTPDRHQLLERFAGLG